MTVDLHVHTWYSSDADHAPEEILAMARGAGMQAVSIADHDAVGGSEAASELSADYGMEVIPNVELTTFTDGCELHLLSYFVDTRHPDLTGLLHQVRCHDEQRAREVVVALQKMGVDINYEEVQEATPQAIAKHSVIVRVAMQNGRNDDLALFERYRNGDRADQPYHNFFLDHCRPGGDAHVTPSSYCATEAAIDIVLGVGGVPVLAHPGGLLSQPGGSATVDRFRKRGLCGLEAFSSYHSEAHERELTDYCDAHDLVATAGSDFHGATVKPGIELGCVGNNDYGIVDRLRRRRDEIHAT